MLAAAKAPDISAATAPDISAANALERSDYIEHHSFASKSSPCQTTLTPATQLAMDFTIAAITTIPTITTATMYTRGYH